MMAMPRPAHYSDTIELPRAFACHGCDARVALTTVDPLPPGWRVTADVKPLYTCPRCARSRRRPGGRPAKPVTTHAAMCRARRAEEATTP